MGDMHRRPIGQRIEWLFDLARRHGEEFRGPEASLARERYLARHPTAIAVLKCMDGRINIPVATGSPAGILMPFRNLGGIFDLGWPHLGEVLSSHVMRMVHAGRRVLLLITYHFAKGDPKRGCAGFHYDTRAAMEHTRDIYTQVEAIFGRGHGTVYPLICGFETDEEALIVHGSGGAVLDLATYEGSADALEGELGALLPDMPTQVRADLAPLLRGNLAHVAAIREENARGARLLDIEHHEWALCLGRGFDFLHTPNVALIVGPYSPNLAEPIHKAATILRSNMEAGRIPDDGLLVLASVPYDDIGVDRARAELKARFLSRFAGEVIARETPDLVPKTTTITAVLDWRSRTLERL